MKNTLRCLLFITFFSTTTVWSQYHSIDRKVVKNSDVPMEVKAAQRTAFRDGFVTEWQIHVKDDSWKNDLTHYMAIFKKDGRFGNYAYYSPEGELFAYSLFVNPMDLPEIIQENTQNYFEGARIKSAELIDLEKPKTYLYRIRLNNEGQLKYLYFDRNGKPLDKNWLPIQIFTFI
ncbi:MAG: hypothetical protein AAFP76_03030 [Bacteroidota bacterium]